MNEPVFVHLSYVLVFLSVISYFFCFCVKSSCKSYHNKQQQRQGNKAKGNEVKEGVLLEGAASLH